VDARVDQDKVVGGRDPSAAPDPRDRAACENARRDADAAHPRASAVLRNLVEGARGDSVTIGEIVEAFGDRAFGFVLILFSLPNCVPAPPGVAGVVGTPVLIFGLQMMLGAKRPWLPGVVLRKSVSVETLRKLIDIAEPRLRMLESVCRPRLTWLFGPTGERLVGLFAFLVAVSVLIPFPGTNFPPSIALVIASIAMMEEDGYFLLGAYLIGLAGLTYTAFVTGAAIHIVEAALTRWWPF
jgi:hypothetical protein